MLFLQYLTMKYSPALPGTVNAADTAEISDNAFDNMTGATIEKRIMPPELAAKMDAIYKLNPLLDVE